MDSTVTGNDIDGDCGVTTTCADLDRSRMLHLNGSSACNRSHQVGSGFRGVSFRRLRARLDSLRHDAAPLGAADTLNGAKRGDAAVRASRGDARRFAREARYKATQGNRTLDLPITNRLLCQLS